MPPAPGIPACSTDRRRRGLPSGWRKQSLHPCRCGSPRCRGTINFDLTDADAEHVEVLEDGRVVADGVLGSRLAEYGAYLRSIGQEQVEQAIANTLMRIKSRPKGSIVCAY